MMSFKQYLKYKASKEYSRQEVANTLGEPFVSALEKMQQMNNGITGEMLSLIITDKKEK